MAQSWLTEKWWWLCLSSSYQSTLHRFFKISCPKRTPPGHRLHLFFKWFKQRKPTREFFQLIWARLFGCMSLHQRRWTLINFFLVDLIDDGRKWMFFKASNQLWKKCNIDAQLSLFTVLAQNYLRVAHQRHHISFPVHSVVLRVIVLARSVINDDRWPDL